MNLDIQTEHVVMRPEWHRMIDEWVGRCARRHPDVIEIDLTLRHGEQRRAGEEVDVVAIAGRRSLHATKQAGVMAVALHDALDALEHELLVHEAVGRRA
jgi:ribosome-associated translation inhibitor RaiA